jgi:hypothetical protein
MTRHERSGVGETNPYAGQADSNVLTAREGWGGQPAHGAGGQRSYEPSQRGPATGVGIRITDITALLGGLRREIGVGRAGSSGAEYQRRL